MRFGIFGVVTMKIAVRYDVTQYKLLDLPIFGRTLQPVSTIIATEAAGFTETSFFTRPREVTLHKII